MKCLIVDDDIFGRELLNCFFMDYAETIDKAENGAEAIRKSERRIRHIPFLLSEDSEFIKPEKTVTLNIADGGCFIYSTNEWTVGARVWLRFIDNDKVMTAIVCWWQPWGNSKKMPGIGVIFD